MRSLKERLSALERSARGKLTHPHEAAAEAEGKTAGAAGSADPEPLGPTSERQGSAVVGDDAAQDGHNPLSSALTALGFCVEKTPHGPVWVRTLRYDALTRHGARRLGALRDVTAAPLERLLRHPFNPEAVRFYDTETTGLGTGAGTFAFLHAVGWLEEDEFVIEQSLVADYTAEAPLLRRLWERHFEPAEAVVSFNGKAFDWSLLRSRMALHRIDVEVDKPHLDLLHPVRRLWKARLERVSLQSVEAAALGLRRQGDLPGKEAPDRYFRFLQQPSPDLLEPVLAHNASDVCTLAVLAAELADCLANGRAETAAEYAALGRLYDEWQAHDLADRCFEQAVSCPDAGWRVQWLGSLYWKRNGEWEKAESVWQDMALRYPWSVAPLVELAKLAEHRRRDLAAAQRWAEEALRRALVQARERQRTAAAGTAFAVTDEDEIRALRHRLERICRKRAAAQSAG
jgi:uncharacterized protein YprB with RNaseH-like and TPR domain